MKKILRSLLALALLAALATTLMGCGSRLYQVEAVVITFDTYKGTMIEMQDGSLRWLHAVVADVLPGDVLILTVDDNGTPYEWHDDIIKGINAKDAWYGAA